MIKEIKKEIDHNCTDEIVCPYCGYEFSDSFEFENNDQCGSAQCYECDKYFKFSVFYASASYSSQKLKEPK